VPHGDRPGFAYQPALDGVRAVAVAAVLLFHGGVEWLPGGFLGVDAFFVLSGFLITSLVLAEYERDGRVRLGAFWARRARRLLPALLVVLVVVVVASRWILPTTEIGLLRGDGLAALAYVANWRMIYRGGGDYFAQTAAPSPLQHTWSLGIEEQFYLLWPLALAGLLALRPWHWSRRALLTVSVGGAVASALATAALYDRTDINRAYFGTDTRAQALLAGCALAVLLSGRDRGDAPATGRHRILGTAAAVAMIAVGWLWVRADGAASWLYRGGFTIGAVAVTLLIAHAVLSPGSPTARVLAIAPLVWLGRISYGVYLWHWPLFEFVNQERTALTGPALLGTRCAVTIAVAAVSYLLIEQPIRNRRWPRPVPLVVRAGVVASVGAVVAVIALATIPPAQPSLTPAEVAAVPAPALPPSRQPALGDRPARPGAPPPTQRPGRRPGAEARITFLGDSVSGTLGTYLPRYPGLAVTVEVVNGCGIARLPDILQEGTPHTNYPKCPNWNVHWQAGVTADDPDVAVILLDRWELMDRRLAGVYQHVGQPAFDQYLTRELELGISIAGSRGARVVLLTAPYTHRAERPDGGLYDEDQPSRVDAWNSLLRTVAAGHPDTVRTLDLEARVCPDGHFTWSVRGLKIRSDGLHFTPEGVQQWIAPWLLPQLAAIAAGG
jgi:peptidoglycan/LPS O-acetylase OafA/YrhL